MRSGYQPWHCANWWTRPSPVCDDELGALAAYARDDLPQMPAGLGGIRLGTDVVRGVAASTEQARLAAGSAAVGMLAGRRLGRPVIAGATATEARGRALRQRWAELDGAALPAESWSSHPAARRWWKALTLNFAVCATMHVERLSDGVHRAVVRDAAGSVIGIAVEGEPGDAAAFAALQAVGERQWKEFDGAHSPLPATPCGASPARLKESASPIDWADDAWTWPAALGAGEQQFSAVLQRLPDGSEQLVSKVDDELIADLSVTHVVVQVIR